MTPRACIFILLAVVPVLAAPRGKKVRAPEPSALDRYIQEATARAATARTASAPGSIWAPSSPLLDGVRDVRAAAVDDLVTIEVVEQASAVVKGSTSSNRSSSTDNSISALGGLTRSTGPLANLASMKGDSKLSGEGSTSRETVLSTTLAARVTHVLPNGLLVVEGSKNIQVNSEQQYVAVRGVVRPADLNEGNVVRSDRIAYLEVRVNGKGVVGDAVRRPFFLYRLLLGLLPL